MFQEHLCNFEDLKQSVSRGLWVLTLEKISTWQANMPFDKDGLAGDLEVHTTERAGDLEVHTIERASVASASTWRAGTLI